MLPRPVVWVFVVAVCTVGLIVPINIDHEQFGSQTWLRVTFLIAKTVHVTMYLLMTCLSGWLRVPVRFRLLLLFFLMFHGAATEFAQGFVPMRSGTPRDVCLDNVGVLLGLLASWKWWTEPDAPAAAPDARDTV